jgi:putative Mg2+ transporter-C (MgtC) family protein
VAGPPPAVSPALTVTPTSSWLNLVERWFRELTDKTLARMDRTHTRAGREVPPADYVLEVVCEAGAEAEIRALIVESVAGPELQLRSLRSIETTTPNEVRVHAEVSAALREDTVLEDAIARFSMEPRLRSARWSIHDEAAVDWTGKDR